MALGVASLVAFAARFAVAAFPLTLPTIVFVTVRLVKGPTLVKLELTTFGASVFPVKVPASAVTVIGAVPSNATPLMALGVASLVASAASEAVAAFPVVEPELPVTLPAIGLVTVRLVKGPTLVKLELTTFDASVFPVKVPASAVIVIGALPSNGTPLMVLGVTNLVAVAALPLILPAIGEEKVFIPAIV